MINSFQENLETSKKSSKMDTKTIQLQINNLLENNQQCIQKVSEGPYSLQRAISTVLYGSDDQYEKLQNESIELLKTLIHQKAQLTFLLIIKQMLPRKLMIFDNNLKLFIDFCDNYKLIGFEKVNLELYSLLSKRQINIYSVTSEFQLKFFVINNKFDKSIDLFKQGSHYDILFPTTQTQEICQDLVKEILQNADTISNDPSKSEDQSKNVQPSKTEENSQIGEEKSKILQLLQNQSPKETTKEFKRYHKKSLSDQFNINFQQFMINKQQNEENEMMQPDKFIEDILDSNNIKEDDKNDKIRKKSSFFYSDDLFKYQLKSMKFEVNEDDVESKVTYKMQQPPGLLDKNFNQKSELKNFNAFFTKENVQHQNESSLNNSLKNSQEAEQMPDQPSKQNSPPFTFNQPDNMLKINKQNDNFLSTEDIQSMNQQDQLVQKLPYEENFQRHIGRLKFFDENKNYGFIVKEDDNSDLFVHFDDLQKADISKEYLKSAKNGNIIRLSFEIMGYIGKYDKSRKAINIELLQQPNLQNFNNFNQNQMYNINNHFISNNNSYMNMPIQPHQQMQQTPMNSQISPMIQPNMQQYMQQQQFLQPQQNLYPQMPQNNQPNISAKKNQSMHNMQQFIQQSNDFNL